MSADRLIWVTACGEPVEHAVTALDLAAGCRSDTDGALPALCGRRFLAAPLVADPGAPCPWCVRFARTRATLHRVKARVAGPTTPHGFTALLSRISLAASRIVTAPGAAKAKTSTGRSSSVRTS